MEQSAVVSKWAWADVEQAWAVADGARDNALRAISETAIAVGAVGRLLAGRRAQCSTQSEFEALLASCTQITPDEARKCIAVNDAIALKKIDTADHGSVRQLLLNVGLIPEPEPGLPSPPQDSPWWVRETTKIDAKVGKMTPDERNGLRRWCEAMVVRLSR